MPNVLDDAADEVADQIISMARQTPDGLAFLDRVLSRLAQARFLPAGPVVTDI